MLLSDLNILLLLRKRENVAGGKSKRARDGGRNMGEWNWQSRAVISKL